jgi:hypothetical protein
VGGLAILPHIDVQGGVLETLSATEWTAILCDPGLAALEYKNKVNLEAFSDSDTEPARRQPWLTRLAQPFLAERGLARVMSSDAHKASDVGQDTVRRTLTRLRLDDLNWNALRNALLLNPKARCKPEAVLPPTYPRIERVAHCPLVKKLLS